LQLLSAARSGQASNGIGGSTTTSEREAVVAFKEA
jgi:hypothetical protein